MPPTKCQIHRPLLLHVLCPPAGSIHHDANLLRIVPHLMLLLPHCIVCNCGLRDRNDVRLSVCLGDTNEHFGPDLLLLFKMHEIWSVNSQQKY